MDATTLEQPPLATGYGLELDRWTLQIEQDQSRLRVRWQWRVIDPAGTRQDSGEETTRDGAIDAATAAALRLLRGGR